MFREPLALEVKPATGASDSICGGESERLGCSSQIFTLLFESCKFFAPKLTRTRSRSSVKPCQNEETCYQEYLLRSHVSLIFPIPVLPHGKHCLQQQSMFLLHDRDIFCFPKHCFPCGKTGKHRGDI